MKTIREEIVQAITDGFAGHNQVVTDVIFEDEDTITRVHVEGIGTLRVLPFGIEASDGFPDHLKAIIQLDIDALLVQLKDGG